MTARSITGHDGHALATGERYLLFAGTKQPPNGGLGDLVGTFTSEEAARIAFQAIRLRASAPASWAQLAVVDGDQRIEPLCWFGIGAEPRRQPRFQSSTPHSDPLTSERKRATTKTTATDMTTITQPNPTRPGG